jgi:hypothetical protein
LIIYSIFLNILAEAFGTVIQGKRKGKTPFFTHYKKFGDFSNIIHHQFSDGEHTPQSHHEKSPREMVLTPGKIL